MKLLSYQDVNCSLQVNNYLGILVETYYMYPPVQRNILLHVSCAEFVKLFHVENDIICKITLLHVYTVQSLFNFFTWKMTLSGNHLSLTAA